MCWRPMASIGRAEGTPGASGGVTWGRWGAYNKLHLERSRGQREGGK
jgi:hypothetical protein